MLPALLLLVAACTDPGRPASKPTPPDTSGGDSGVRGDSAGDSAGDSGTDSGVDTGPAPRTTLDLGGFTPRNVVLVNIDTLRADSLREWGSERDTMPTLTRRGGWASVERAVSTASWTAPSTASLLSGAPPHVHDVRFFDDSLQNFPLAVPSFATHLQGQGVATALVTGSNVVVNPVWELDQGFDYVGRVDTEPSNAEAVVADAVAWLDTLDAGDPFLLFLQPMDMHNPYRPADEDQWTWADADDAFFDLDGEQDPQDREIREALQAAFERSPEERAALLVTLRAIYEEQALGVDRALAGLMDDLAARGLLDETLFVVTADHGETFYDGDFRYLGHSGFPRHDVVHIPLLFGGAMIPDQRVGCLASNMDVFPTVVEAMGLLPLDGTEGRSLLGACREYAYSDLSESAEGVETLLYLSAESLTAQLVFDCVENTETAFNLTADPLATEPVSVSDLPDGAALAAALRGHASEVLSGSPDLTCAIAMTSP